MNLILLSSLDGALHQPVSRHLARASHQIARSDRIHVAYLQYLSGADSYVEKTQKFYETIGVPCQVTPIDLDQRFEPRLLDDMMHADLLHLPGGNTFAFIKAIRHRSAAEHIFEFVRSGRMVVGVSAGALVLAPSIATARFGDDDASHDGDDRGLGIIDFEPFPHWNTQSHYESDLAKYSAQSPYPIRIFDDASGIAISSDGLTSFGVELVMLGGKIQKVEPVGAGR